MGEETTDLTGLDELGLVARLTKRIKYKVWDGNTWVNSPDAEKFKSELDYIAKNANGNYPPDIIEQVKEAFRYLLTIGRKGTDRHKLCREASTSLLDAGMTLSVIDPELTKYGERAVDLSRRIQLYAPHLNTWNQSQTRR